MARLRIEFALCCIVFGWVEHVRAEEERTPISAEVRDAAETAFNRGTEQARATRWNEALSAFEEAQRLIPHPITLFNIGASERALGRYAAARETFTKCLEQDRKGPLRLPDRLRDDANGFLKEIEFLLVRVEVTVEPTGASLAIDGRPIAKRTPEGSDAEVWVAGVAAPGARALVPPSFSLEVDPGRRVFTFSRPGHTDGVVVRDFDPGSRPKLALSLNELPATIQILSNEPGSLVTIGGRDAGPAPVTLLRPAGQYKVIVEKDGFVTAETELTVKAGEESTFRATLPVDEPSVLETWWFWTLTGTALAGVGVATYFLAREEPPPQRATIGDGSLGWRIPLP
jgi:hypothetical protein